MPTAFVFAGGGSLGAIQVGVLRELVQAGERPDFLVGASVGALNACFFAGNPTAEGVSALETIWTGLRRRDVFPVTPGSMLAFARGGSSVFAHARLRTLIDTYLPFQRLEEARIPVHVVATNLSGAAVSLSSGNASDAILASSAIPIAFPSVRIGMDDLMDGAIAGNTPILTAAELGADRIIVLQTGYACSMDGPPKASIARGLHALTLMISNQLKRDMSLLDGQASIHLAPHLCPLDVSPFNFDHGAALIDRAASLTRAWIAAGGLRTRSAPADTVHDHAGMAMPAFPYDLVSYFRGDGAPLKGSEVFSASHDGRAFLFATAENRDSFLACPQVFLPQYGGACAFAMGRNKDVRSDPLVFAVIGGRLYFNRDKGVHSAWLRAVEAEISKADNHWAGRMNTGKLRA